MVNMFHSFHGATDGNDVSHPGGSLRVCPCIFGGCQSYERLQWFVLAAFQQVGADTTAPSADENDLDRLPDLLLKPIAGMA
jgi:hypothetical protein